MDNDRFNENEKNNRSFEFQRLELSENFASKQPDLVPTLSKHQLIYSVAGLILGCICVLGGIVLFLNGVVGSTNWTAKILGAESRISDAAPGAVLFIVGLFIVYITRYIFKVNR